jgi:hypothetical protein
MFYEDEEDGLSPKERAMKELLERRSINSLNTLLVNKLKDMREEKAKLNDSTDFSML